MSFDYKEFKALSFKASKHFKLKHVRSMNTLAEQSNFKNMDELREVMINQPNDTRLLHAQKLTNAYLAATYLGDEIPTILKTTQKSDLIAWINKTWVEKTL